MLKSLIRLTAGMSILVFFAPTLVGPLAAEADGACNFASEKGCITTNSAYEDKKCVSGEGEDCISCDEWPGAVCTWSQGEEDLEDYCDEQPCPL